MKSCSPFEKRLSLPGPTKAQSNEEQFLTQNNSKQSNVFTHSKNTESGKSYPRFQCKTTRKEHESYHQGRLMRSGDIEIQPGPVSCRKKNKKTNILLITTILIIITINKIKSILEMRHKISTSQSQHQHINTSHLPLLLLKKTLRRRKTNNNASAYLSILLIIAGDIHPRPGPPSLSHSTEAVKCNQCNTWTHTSLNNQERAHQWICPNPNCTPTYCAGLGKNIPIIENRFSIISGNIEDLIIPNIKNEDHTITPTRECLSGKVLKTKDMFKHLPRISSREYIGKDICRVCYKTVGENQRAVSCDECERWLHIKCTDMESKTYKMFREKRIFNWICHKCRDVEIPTPTRVNLKQLQSEDYPTTMEELTAMEGPLILSLNCRSIIKKVDELKQICYTLKPAIVCLTETWLDYTVPQNFIVPEGYIIIRKDRSENFKQKYGKANGGGIAILHQSNIKIKRKSIGDEDDESLWVEVTMKRKFLLGLSYRAEYTDLLTEKEGSNKLNNMLETAHVISNNILYLGDLNCDYKNENPDNATQRLTETCSAYGMNQLITTPTRITDDCKTTIDHIWTDPSKYLIKGSGTCIGISDHLATYATLDFKPSKTPCELPKIRRNWRNYNVNEFRETLISTIERSNIEDSINQKDVNKSLDALTGAIQQSLNQHAPLKEMKVRSKKTSTIPWFNKEIEDKKEEKNNCLKLFHKFGDQKDKYKAQHINNVLTHLKEKSKKKYYTDKLTQCEGDSKQTWKILKELTDGYNERQQTEPDNMDQIKSNYYNNYFATVGSDIQKKLNVKDKEVKTNTTGFSFIPETEENIIKLIDRIRNDVAVGVDGINTRVLKDGKEIIAPALTKIINLGYETNEFPDQLKIAVIKPIHKKDCHNSPANYRPISILPIISKVFERSAVDQLVQYLENDILSGSQHAYRKGHSTITSLAEVTNKIYQSLDKGLIVGMASMDLSKAFDAISHTHLLQKLSDMGLQTNSVTWIKSYLNSRKQRTAFKNVTSDESTVTSGVPQGSILGPILFLCFTNEHTNSFPEAKVVSYADDSQFIVTGKKMETIKAKLEEIIEKAEKWYKANSLMSNPSKTEVIIFTPTRNNTLPTITSYENGKKFNLEVSKELKILGVYIDSSMSWDTHITKLRNKTIGVVKHLHRINKLLPMKTKLTLYDSLVASHLNYADVIWSGCSLENKKRLQTVQNFALKSILNKKKSDSATEALKTLKYLDLEEKRKIHEAVFIHKILKGKKPKNLTEEYEKLQPRLNHRSADKSILNIPAHKTSKFKSSVLYRTIKTWNEINVERKKEDTSTFKKSLQSHMTKSKYKAA